MDSAEIWQAVFQNLSTNADSYLLSEQIRSKYKNPETSVTFRVDDTDHRINACVRRIARSSYDIRIFAGLVAALESFSDLPPKGIPALS